MRLRKENLNPTTSIYVSFDAIDENIVTLEYYGQLIKFWDFPSFALRNEIAIDTSKLTDLELSPNGEYLVVGIAGGSRLYARENSQFVSPAPFYTNGGRNFKFTSDSTKLIDSVGGYVSVFDLHSQTYISHFEEAGERCQGIWVHADNDLIATSGCSGAASRVFFFRLSQQDDPENRISLRLPYNELTPPTISPNGKLLAVGHFYPGVYAIEDAYEPNLDYRANAIARYLFDLDGSLIEDKSIEKYVTFQDLWSRQLFDERRNALIAGSPQGKIFQWNLDDGSIRSQIQAHSDKIFDIAISPDGNSLVSCGKDSYVRVWDLD